MSTRINKQSDKLPDIPDYPNSPLSAWKHYGILRALEGKFHKELENQGYEGHLVGLSLAYKVGPDPYSMGFGYGVDGNENPLARENDPLTDEFVSGMYDFASELISTHINPYVPDYSIQLAASINPNVSTVEVNCMIATDANCGKDSCNGKCRKFIRRNGGPWVCTHTKGSCRCS